MSYFDPQNLFLSSANNEAGHESLMRHKYFLNHNLLSNFVETRIDSILPKEKNCKRYTKSNESKITTSKSRKEAEEQQKESYIVSRSRRPSSTSKERDSSTSSQEYATESERSKKPKKNPKKQKKRLKIRILDPRHQSTRTKIVVKIPPTKNRNGKPPEAGDNSKTANRTRGQTSIKGREIVEIPCGEAGKWKYIRMYQERNRRREARRKRQKEKEAARGSGRRRSSKKRRKSKKRSKSRSRRKSRRKSRNRSKSRRSRSSSKSKSRKGSTKRRRRRG